ncbi:MAG TPA: hypothetical protein ENI27_10885 [bacterium]|nr:hypothetical protein [bacterium]
MYLLPLPASLVGMNVLAFLIEGLSITRRWQCLVIGAVVRIGLGSTATITAGTFEDISPDA